MSKKRYDIGVFGVWYGCNYGSVASYYGLNRTLEKLGYSVLMIDKPDLGKKNDMEMGMTHSRRFAKEHYNISQSYSLKNLEKLNELCDTFVLGSDQVWNYGVSKNFGKAKYFDFVRDDKKKIAYASSFGHEVDFAPEDEQKNISKLMRRFDAISIREEQGVKLAEKIYGVKAKYVVDSAFLVEKEIYEELAVKSRFKEKKPYIASYILDPTPKIREALLHVSKELKLPLINVLDGVPWLWKKNKEKLNLDVVADVQIEEWLYILKNSEFVITDSYHGSIFAALFGKTFIPIVNKHRGKSRFSSLGSMLDITERLIDDPTRILNNASCLKPMDTEFIALIIESNRWLSKEWLKTALETPKELLPSVFSSLKSITKRIDEKMCIGCGACICACPTKALSYKQDVWGYYRSAVTDDRCKECRRCRKVCPSIKLPKRINSKTPICYAAKASDEKLLENSSSGGIFSLMSRSIIDSKGYVVGAAWTKEFSVEHIVVDNREDLEKLQKSKYLQSFMGNTFLVIKEKLLENKRILFSGTPCQVAGLTAYLGKEYDNLILVDILCSYAPSSMFFKKYLRESFPEGISKYTFRDKEKGWDCTSISVVTKNGDTVVRRGGTQDAFQRVFHNRLMCSVHCETCKYQKLPRFGDITIGDFWGIERRDKDIDTKKGVSVVLCNNEKGKSFFNSLSDNLFEIRKEVPLEWLGNNGNTRKGKSTASPKRDLFYQGIQRSSFTKAINNTLD
jgi:coenzyme F420-reducing hydrogenase beta subunit